MASTGDRLPSFLPPDPKVEEPYLLTPRMAMRVAILGGIALIAFGVLFLRLWSLQILSPEKYETAALENQLRRDLIEAPRGTIVDRNGRALVRNVVSTAVVLWPANLPPGAGRDTEVRELAKILDVPFWKLRRQIRSHQSDPLTPVTLKVSVSPEVIAYLEEHKSELPGVDLKQTYLRSYPAESLLAQVLGYVNEISAEQLKRMRKEGYVLGDRIGQSGVEAAFDTYLRGTAGIAELRVDSLGRPKSELTLTRAPKPGDNIRLTIDVSLQRAAERALQYGIARAHADGEWAANGGSIVALDPNTGDVLAMASNPTFRPSVYTGRDDEKLKPLLDAETARRENYPGLNRGHRCDLSAGLDLQADHRAGRPAGASGRPVHAPALHGLVQGGGRHRRRPGVQQLGPQRQPRDGDVGSDRGLLRHVLLPPGDDVLRPATGARPPAPGVGQPLRDRRPVRCRHRPRGEGNPAHPRVARGHVHERDRQALEAG